MRISLEAVFFVGYKIKNVRETLAVGLEDTIHVHIMEVTCTWSCLPLKCRVWSTLQP